MSEPQFLPGILHLLPLRTLLTAFSSVRIWYTVNHSPQYILARSSERLAVLPIPLKTTSGPRYATAPLKSCLHTICRSRCVQLLSYPVNFNPIYVLRYSPDLVQGPGRDFSLYVLDPLEHQSAPSSILFSSELSSTNHPPFGSASTNLQVPATNDTKQSGGVAVGLGLMSWALATPDEMSTSVTGTLVLQPSGEWALEVVFALREVR